jgi:3'(2'), 5'-bisphosphate nucleotidase
LSSVHRRPDAFALDSHTRDEIALFLAKAALAAGPAVMEEYDRGCEVASKADGSPVTSADQRAEVIISDYLTRLTPLTPLCAEEATAAGAKPQVAKRFLLVDPLDGTREFLAGNGEFTVIGRLWVGGDTAFACEIRLGAESPDEGSQRHIQTRRAPSSLVAFASRSHLDARSDAFLKGLPIGETRFAGSSLKFCLIAEGLGDVYPRFAPTMEWDTAACDAVLRAAGGAVLDPSGRALFYGKTESSLRNGPFIAWGDPTAAKQFGY